MKIALVYDRVNKIGGAERILLALHEIWPEAPLYTAVYNSQTAPWAKDFEVKTSFLQKFPLAKTRHELYPWLTPAAFESLDLGGFDVVISVSSAEAKGVLTKPSTLHLCYCLTPSRYLWSGFREYSVPFIFKPLLSLLRSWDQTASLRPDKYIAISKAVALRIKKYYHQWPSIIYPPVDTDKFVIDEKETGGGNYYLIVSRLVPYKRIDIAVKAFNKLGIPLVIIGTGSETSKLKRIARSNISFLGQLTDEEVLRYYQRCLALIFPSHEDLGLVPLEAQACGRPVIAYRNGGALETVLEGVTGEFFPEQEPQSLVDLVRKFDPLKYDCRLCRKQAERFNLDIFKRKFKEFTEKAWENYSKNISI